MVLRVVRRGVSKVGEGVTPSSTLTGREGRVGDHSRLDPDY